jgi:hypothetical protein
MSLATKMTAFVSSVGTDIKNLTTKIGNLANLQTTDKSSLVSAINELKSFQVTNIDDVNASTTTTFSGIAIQQKISAAKTEVKNEILGGASTAYDTLQEIQGFIENDSSATASLVTAVADRVKYSDVGNLETDLVAIYNTAKS